MTRRRESVAALTFAAALVVWVLLALLVAMSTDDGEPATIDRPTTTVTVAVQALGPPATDVVESLPGAVDGEESPATESATGQGPTSEPDDSITSPPESITSPATTVPPSSVVNPGPVGAVGSGACGGSLPPCWVMMAESGGNPQAVNWGGCGGRNCYGKWQFDPLTSQGLGYPGVMTDYDEATQDEAARTLWAGGAGCSHWAAC